MGVGGGGGAGAGRQPSVFFFLACKSPLNEYSIYGTMPAQGLWAVTVSALVELPEVERCAIQCDEFFDGGK